VIYFRNVAALQLNKSNSSKLKEMLRATEPAPYWTFRLNRRRSGILQLETTIRVAGEGVEGETTKVRLAVHAHPTVGLMNHTAITTTTTTTTKVVGNAV
jgi:hypothetical protein